VTADRSMPGGRPEEVVGRSPDARPRPARRRGDREATIRCPACGAEVAAAFRFCGMCGFRLPRSAVAAGQVDASTGVGATSPMSTAERRFVTVLFLDLVDYTPLTERLDPEETRDLQARYFDLMAERIAVYGGTVEKYIGDAVMAVWGAPVAHEDDAERGVRAALDVLASVPRLRRELGVPAVALRIGVASGEVAFNVGAIGHGLIAGHVVNTASRLQSAARPGTCFVDEPTRRATEAAIAFEPVGELRLKGKRSTASAWRPTRLLSLLGGGGRLSRQEPPLIGRGAEFEILRSAFLASPDERPGLITIVGRAGVGKSRLVWELQKFTDGYVGPVYWHVGHCPAYGEGLAFRPLADALRRRLGIADGDSNETSLARLRESLAWFVPDPEEQGRIGPALATLLGLAESDPGDREERFSAWRLFLERVAERAPTILVLEDIHRAESELLDFVDHLVTWSRPARILTVLVGRSELLERRDHPAGREGAVLVRLEPLSRPEMTELVASMAPALPERLTSQLLERAAGIPLYAVETLRMLGDTGTLGPGAGRPESAAEGAHGPTDTGLALDVPASLQALISARLDALEPEARALALEASVLGTVFRSDALATVSLQPAAVFERALERLAAREIVVRDVSETAALTGRLRFIDGLVREVAYATLARRDRRLLHLRAADALEARPELADPAALAAHLLAAFRTSAAAEQEVLAERTVPALVRAGERALAIGAPEQALAWLREALDVVRNPTERAGLEEAAGAAALTTAFVSEAEQHLRRALAAYRERHDQASTVRTTTRLAATLLVGYRPADAIDEITRVVEEIGLPGTILSDAAGPDQLVNLADPDLTALLAELARANLFLDRDERAVALARRVIRAAEALDLVGVLIEARTTLGLALAGVGQRSEGASILRQAIVEAEGHGLVATSLRARHDLVVALLLEDPVAGLSEARLGLAIATRVGIRWAVVRLTGVAVEAALEAGEWDWLLAAVSEVRRFVIPDPDRAEIEGAAAVVAGWRDPPTGAAALAALRRDLSLHAEGGPMASAVADYRESVLALGAGDARLALDMAVRAGEGLLAAGWRWAVREGWWQAARAAGWAGDREAFRDAARLIRGVPGDGRWLAAVRSSIDAFEAALEGDRIAARASVAASIEQWRALGVRFGLALALLDAAVITGAPIEPELREVLADLRAADAPDRILAGLAQARGPTAAARR
jgi:class 3 adenylate cyclase